MARTGTSRGLRRDTDCAMWPNLLYLTYTENATLVLTVWLSKTGFCIKEMDTRTGLAMSCMR